MVHHQKGKTRVFVPLARPIFPGSKNRTKQWLYLKGVKTEYLREITIFSTYRQREWRQWQEGWSERGGGTLWNLLCGEQRHSFKAIGQTGLVVWHCSDEEDNTHHQQTAPWAQTLFHLFHSLRCSNRCLVGLKTPWTSHFRTFWHLALDPLLSYTMRNVQQEDNSERCRSGSHNSSHQPAVVLLTFWSLCILERLNGGKVEYNV